MTAPFGARNLARPSQNLDKKLLNAAKKIAIKSGLSSMSIRGLCNKTGVNVGMFTYLFGTREKFIECIHKDIFHEFMNELKTVVNSSTVPLERLKLGILKLAEVASNDRLLFLGLIRDTLNKDPVTLKMLKNFVPEDIILILDTIVECQKSGDLPKSLHPLEIFSILMPPLLMASLFASGFHSTVGKHLGELNTYRVDDKNTYETRLNILLKGLKAWE